MNRRLKVAWAAPCVGVGGADAYMLGLMRYSHELEHVGIALRRESTSEQLEWARKQAGSGLNIVALPNGVQGNDYGPAWQQALAQVCHDADVLISWSIPNMPAMPIPVVELAQNVDTEARQLCESNKPDFTVAVSQAVNEAVFDGKANAVIPNAVDPARCTPRWGGGNIRRSWGLSEDDKIILFAGRLVDEKWPQGPLLALRELPQHKLVYVGAGYRKDDLIAQARMEQLHDRVFFVDSQFHLGDMFDVADVFCLPSDFEGLPLAVLEAWLAGVPVVVTNIPPIEEIHRACGQLSWTVSPRCSIEDLADAIRSANRDDPRVPTAHGVVWNNFCLPKAALRWSEFLHEAVYTWRKNQSRPTLRPLTAMQPMTSSKTSVREVKYL